MRLPYVLVPGAWMGEWIWTALAGRLRSAGYPAVALTLTGLEHGAAPAAVAEIGLERHVDDVCEAIAREGFDRVILVGHSYSGTVVGQAADRIPERVARSIHIATFLPRDGRSLLDDWGPDEETRAAEKEQVRADGMLWTPPPRPALDGQPDLTPEQRDWLAARFVPHPGRTVLDPARMSRPVTDQPVTYISLAPPGRDPVADLPPEMADGIPAGWRLRTLASGHWPMTAKPDRLAALLLEAEPE